MSQATTCPKIVHDVQSYSLIEGEVFSINISELFHPRDGSLQFYLKTTHNPDWLHLDKDRGLLYGVAPMVTYSKHFKILLTASNEMGYVSKSLVLTIVDTDVVDTMPETLEHILSRRKEHYPFSHLHPYTPSLIEYLYYFYQDPEYVLRFEISVKKAAAEYNIKLKDKVSCHDFATVINKINPDFEKILKEKLGKDHILNKETLNNQQLRNLYRQGSQPAGVIAIPVWNHCGNPDLYDWPDWNPITNVLDSAGEAVKRLKNLNIDQKKEMSSPENVNRPISKYK